MLRLIKGGLSALARATAAFWESTGSQKACVRSAQTEAAQRHHGAVGV